MNTTVLVLDLPLPQASPGIALTFSEFLTMRKSSSPCRLPNTDRTNWLYINIDATKLFNKLPPTWIDLENETPLFEAFGRACKWLRFFYSAIIIFLVRGLNKFSILIICLTEKNVDSRNSHKNQKYFIFIFYMLNIIAHNCHYKYSIFENLPTFDIIDNFHYGKKKLNHCWACD